MQAALGARQRRIRIFRPESRPSNRFRFQPEWEPIPDPYTNYQRIHAVCGPPQAIRLPRIPYRYRPAVTGTVLTVALTAVVSLGMTVKAVGLTPDAGAFWLSAWQMAALIAVPARFLLAPLISKAIAPIIEPPVLE